MDRYVSSVVMALIIGAMSAPVLADSSVGTTGSVTGAAESATEGKAAAPTLGSWYTLDSLKADAGSSGDGSANTLGLAGDSLNLSAIGATLEGSYAGYGDTLRENQSGSDTESALLAAKRLINNTQRTIQDAQTRVNRVAGQVDTISHNLTGQSLGIRDSLKDVNKTINKGTATLGTAANVTGAAAGVVGGVSKIDTENPFTISNAMTTVDVATGASNAYASQKRAVEQRIDTLTGDNKSSSTTTRSTGTTTGSNTGAGEDNGTSGGNTGNTGDTSGNGGSAGNTGSTGGTPGSGNTDGATGGTTGGINGGSSSGGTTGGNSSVGGQTGGSGGTVGSTGNSFNGGSGGGASNPFRATTTTRSGSYNAGMPAGAAYAKVDPETGVTLYYTLDGTLIEEGDVGEQNRMGMLLSEEAIALGYYYEIDPVTGEVHYFAPDGTPIANPEALGLLDKPTPALDVKE